MPQKLLILAALVAAFLAACQPGFRSRRVTYSTGKPLQLTANFPFSEIECVRIDLGDIRRRPDKMARTVWKARCSDGTDCLTSVRYGDPGLQIITEPEPLAPTDSSSECYMCLVKGTKGTGSVGFAVDDEGRFDHCNLQLP